VHGRQDSAIGEGKTMPKTVTFEVPDDLVPVLDKVLTYWRYRHTDEVTLQHVFRHGLDMMGYRDPPGPDDNPFTHPRIDDEDDDLPF
jgi:hypothetical protein